MQINNQPLRLSLPENADRPQALATNITVLNPTGGVTTVYPFVVSNDWLLQAPLNSKDRHE